jgi:hypothetical protein
MKGHNFTSLFVEKSLYYSKPFCICYLALSGFAAAEKLSERFQPELFRWVNANNSIDHTDNPVLAVQEMSKLVCKGDSDNAASR